jgi:ACS family glucarate transporter-like MFS transporter
VKRRGVIPVRFRIMGVLFVMCFVNYLLRNNLSIAIPSIQEEFSFTNAEIGWILGSFNFSYALLQIPGGIFGQIYGPRRALAFMAVSWGVLTFLTGFVPTLMAASATGVVVSLLVTRLLLGATNAPIFPVMAATFARWFPEGSWGFPNGMLSVGLALGQAAIGPIVTMLIVHYGWRGSFYVFAPLGLLIGAWWYWYGRDRPAQHPDITADEVRLIEGPGPMDGTSREPALRERGAWRRMLVHRDVLLLTASYFCMNYVFYMFAQWLFTYLVNARGFSLLESGWLYVLPFASGAVLAGVGGLTCDALCKRVGATWGCRLPAISGLILVAIFLIAGVDASNPYVAVGLLSLCFGFTQFTEGSFWAASTYIAGANTAAATGVMNTGGNAAGFLAPVVGLMVDHFGWLATLASGSVFALIGAALWLMVRIGPRVPK